MSEKNNYVKYLSYEWERLPNGLFKRVERPVVEVTFQESFVDDSDFMPSINGIVENMNGSSGSPLYHFNNKDDEYDNAALVNASNPGLDITEVDKIIESQSLDIDNKLSEAKEDIENQIKELSDNSSKPSNSEGSTVTN